MHYKRKRPRTRGARFRLERDNWRGRHFKYGKNPSWFNLLFNIRPARRRDKQNLILIMKGEQPELWEDYSRPYAYYW